MDTNINTDLVQEGERRLAGVARKTGMTQEGMDWLIEVLDPMHDKPIPDISGWPDMATGSSIVRCIKQSASIKTPYGSTENWNCHVVAWPFLHADGFYTHGHEGNSYNFSGTTPILHYYGGVQAFASKSNSYNWISDAPPYPISGALTSVASLELNPTYDKGFGRLVGMGLEVIDTTAEIYKQGMLTAYRVTQDDTRPQTFSIAKTDATIVNAYLPFTPVRPPPHTEAEALLLPGTQQWEARNGSYSVIAFTGEDNEPTLPKFQGITIKSGQTISGLHSNNVSLDTLVTVATPGPILYHPRANRVEKMHTSGVILSGLNPNSTYTLRWNVYYESFPDPSEPDLMVLARPPSPYDPVALEFMKRQTLEMPVAVYASMNPGGEWFWDIVEGIESIAPAVGSLFGPEGTAFGAAVGSGARALTSAFKPKQPPKKKQTQPQKPKSGQKGQPRGQIQQNKQTNQQRKRKTNPVAAKGRK